MAGIDRRLADTWRAGIAAGYSRANAEINTLSSSSDDSTAHIGSYLGGAIGPWRLRLGGAYSWNNFSTNRIATFPGFSDHLQSHYQGQTEQVFGEAGYNINRSGIPVEPFAGISYMNLHTDAFHETGAAAALQSPAQNADATYSALGVRAGYGLPLAQDKLSLQGTIAWQHMFGARAERTNLIFENAGASFAVAGVPLDRDTALVEAGAQLRLAPELTIGLDYSGQVGPNFTDHGAKGYVSWNF